MKFKYKFWKGWRIFIILFLVFLITSPFMIKTTNEKVCYKSEASFWGRQDLAIDCSSNSVDLIKDKEYFDLGITQLKNILIATLIINLFIWLSGSDWWNGDQKQ